MIEQKSGSFAPFRHRTFAALWTAALVSNIGTWMHEVGAGWLMTELTDNPLLVSLVSSSTSLPVFLFVLIAGALADITDRRRYLLWTQGFMLLCATILTGLTWSGLMSPWLLLFFTFSIGTGAALTMPAWDAIIPEIVPQEDLPQAVALGSIGVNAARAVGPALAGLIIAQTGAYAVFALNTVSFVAVMASLLLWKRRPADNGMAPERFIGAVKEGLRFAFHTKNLQLIMIRSALFFLPAIGLLSLLPLYVREVLQGDARTLGLLQGSMGTGAVLTAFLLPQFKKFLPVDRLLLVSEGILAGVFGLLGYVHTVPAACVALFCGGTAWVTAFSVLRVKAQQAVPDWVRARAMAIVLMTSFGSMAVGGALWGWSARFTGLEGIYGVMAGMTVVAALIAVSFPIAAIESSNHARAEPFAAHDGFVYQPRAEDGPVLVSVEYEVSSGKEAEYLRHIHALAAIRKRNGAYSWHLFHDLERARVYVEQFLLENWAEHERQHARTGQSEKAVHDAVFACLGNGKTPVVRHLLHQGPTLLDTPYPRKGKAHEGGASD